MAKWRVRMPLPDEDLAAQGVITHEYSVARERVRRLEPTVEVSRQYDHEMQTHCLMPCHMCGRQGTADIEVVLTPAPDPSTDHYARWLCAPGFGCRTEPRRRCGTCGAEGLAGIEVVEMGRHQPPSTWHCWRGFGCMRDTRHEQGTVEITRQYAAEFSSRSPRPGCNNCRVIGELCGLCERGLQPERTHWEGCWLTHPLCREAHLERLNAGRVAVGMAPMSAEGFAQRLRELGVTL
jgi:hypothetical protein